MSGLADAELVARARRIPSDPNATALGAGLTLIAMADRLEALEAEFARWREVCGTQGVVMAAYNLRTFMARFAETDPDSRERKRELDAFLDLMPGVVADHIGALNKMV